MQTSVGLRTVDDEDLFCAMILARREIVYRQIHSLSFSLKKK